MSGHELVATAVVGVAIMVGVAGTFLPILPGLLLAWAAVLAYGFLVGFGVIGWVAVTLATALTGLGLYLNVRIPQRHAASTGISLTGQLFALVVAVIGFFLVPVIGFPLGFVVGVYVIRFRATRDSNAAWTSTKSTLVALVKASAAQALCGVAILVVWAGWAASVAFLD